MKRETKLRHYLEAALIYALPTALRPLPFTARISVGGALIGGAIRLVPALRNRILSNLGLVFPDMDRAAQKVFLKKNSRHIGRGFMELFYNQAFHDHLNNIEMAPDALDEIKAAQEKGQPVIVVSGHFGQWEAIRVVLSRAGMPTASIYKDAGNPFFRDHFAKTMAVAGAGLFPVGVSGTRNMLKHLRAGGIVSVLLDQRVNDGVALDFLGQPALSSTIMATLALKSGALMVPAYAFLKPGGGVKIITEPAIPHTAPAEMIAALNDSLSAQVRQRPEQWYWLHRRWAGGAAAQP